MDRYIVTLSLYAGDTGGAIGGDTEKRDAITTRADGMADRIRAKRPKWTVRRAYWTLRVSIPVLAHNGFDAAALAMTDARESIPEATGFSWPHYNIGVKPAGDPDA